MSNSSMDFIGMGTQQNALPDGDKLTNTNRDNPNGDQVDNTAGAQPVTGNTTNPMRNSGSFSFNMYSRPSWLQS